MTRSTPTLTQSGQLAVLLHRQHCKLVQLARRRAKRRHMRAAFESILTWPWRALTASPLAGDSTKPSGGPPGAAHELFTKPSVMPCQIHTYTELREQIHNDLRIQHPEWVQTNGESPKCESYEKRFTELLDVLP